MDFRRILVVADFPSKGDNWTLYVKLDASTKVATAKYWDFDNNQWADFKFVASQA